MENKTINIEVVKKIAIALKHLRQKVAFVGGAMISVYADDPAADEVRPTMDIDLSLTLEGYAAWAKLQDELTTLGFSPDQSSHVICRFKYEDVTVDIMPDDENVIGFSNPWYKPGLQKIQPHAIANDLDVNILPLAYFLATKFSAFNGRGKGNYITSHDFEDIVYLTDNAISLVKQISESEADVREYLKKEYQTIWKNSNRREIISCHLQPLIRSARLKVIEEKIKQIIEL
ncbi:nucleotidyl transferase AbiEii/AbiGii toxin family protein [Ohtaekwangia sp.]|uniref:nucleotidyl transferase AbiEii/AbiGii toxin family protein n=1 Tax=Ohtaekwangia sp. TaxID=2066019 RepID=UPI002F933E11